MPGLFAKWLIRDLAVHLAHHARHAEHGEALLSWNCSQETRRGGKLVHLNHGTVHAVSRNAALRVFVQQVDEVTLPGFDTIYDVRRTPRRGKHIPSAPAPGGQL